MCHLLAILGCSDVGPSMRWSHPVQKCMDRSGKVIHFVFWGEVEVIADKGNWADKNALGCLYRLLHKVLATDVATLAIIALHYTDLKR